MTDTGSGGEPRFSDDRQWWWTGAEWIPASQAPEASASEAANPSSDVAPSPVTDPLTSATGQPEGKGRRVTAGAGMQWPFVAGVGALFLLGVAVAVATKASVIAFVVYVVLGVALVAAVWYRSQRHLLLFRRENGRWPTLPEAEAWNAVVQARSAKSQRVAASQSVLAQAEREYKQNVAAAEKSLKGAQDAHAKAIADATGAASRAEQDYQTKVAAATAALGQWQNPGRGANLGRFMKLQLFQHEIVTGVGASTLLHATASVAGSLLTIQALQAQEVVRFAPKDEAGARAFAAQVNAAAFNEAAFQQQRPSAIPAAEAYLQQVRADRGAIDAADSTRRRQEMDAAFLGATAIAQTGLEATRADTAKSVAARSALETEHASQLKGPEVLAAPSWRPRSLNGGLAAGAVALALLAALGVNTVSTANVASRQVAATAPSAQPTSQAVPSPEATPTPSPISTPTPSPSPLPSPTPTPPPDTHALTVANVITSINSNTNYIFSDDFTNMKVTISGGTINVVATPTTSSEQTIFRNGAADGLVVAEATLNWYPAAQLVHVVLQANFIDANGQTTTQDATIIDIDKGTAAKFNYSGLRDRMEGGEWWLMYYDANGYYVHPAVWKNISGSDAGQLFISCYSEPPYC